MMINYQDSFTGSEKDFKRGSFDFRARNSLFIELMQLPIVAEIVASRPFRRLKHIRFLGAIDYFLVGNPNGYANNQRYTRYEHSLGVAFLALQYAKFAEIGINRLNTLLAAALLHDLGHPPLSHSVEWLFKSKFGVNHHDLTNMIIRGHSYSKSIPDILKNYDVDLDEVINLISGNSDDFSKFFSGPINFDTIEGISRASVYVSSALHIQRPENTVKSAYERRTFASQRVVDEFWTLKNTMYKVVINSPVGVMADFLSGWYVERALNKLSPNIAMSSERTLFRLVPELREALRSRDFSSIFNAGHDQIAYSSRKFFIDESVNFESRKDSLRYRQSKSPEILSLRTVQRSFHDTLTPQWLFND